MQIYSATFVLDTLFIMNFDVVRSAVLVVISPGYVMRFLLAVIRTRLGPLLCAL